MLNYQIIVNIVCSNDLMMPSFLVMISRQKINMSEPGNFIANYEPLSTDKLAPIVEDVLTMSKFSQPMHDLLKEAYQDKQVCRIFCSSRIVDGKPD